MIDQRGIEETPNKVQVVSNMKSSMMVKEIQKLTVLHSCTWKVRVKIDRQGSSFLQDAKYKVSFR